MIVRRDLLKGAAGGAGLALAGIAQAQTGPSPEQPASFQPQSILDLARTFAKSPYKGPSTELPDPFNNLTYDQYVGIRYRNERAIWADDKTGFVIEPLHRGFVFNAHMQINIVENGMSRRLAYKAADFDFGALQPPANLGDIGFSGFRVLAAKDGGLSDIAIFQGASFFRARAAGQTYGVQARGLSLKTGDPRGEEFPLFKAVWIEKPTLANNALVIHALLDSESVAGAYRFTIRPGEAVIVDTEMTLVPRANVENVGIGSMTGTSISSPLDRRRPDDVRPIIAELNGLQMLSGKNEWIWRPVTNRATLQISSFVDDNPKGFGFLLRDRNFEDYQDDEAKWESRPSLWIEPLADFGPGNVQLVEIPAESETNSNCLAYWRPKDGLVAGKEQSWAYRQFWCWEPPSRPPQLVTFESRGGRGAGQKRRRFVVAFSGDALGDPQTVREPKPALSTFSGTVAMVRSYLYRDRKLYRVVYDIDPGGEPQVEMRLVIESDSKPVSETWLYRWTP
ncbi:MAG: glucan biosynthesis protein [Hyphomicrobiales bacterium]|nr:glucan biosynthesis protein [Hyphomicrobiales bacterium]